MTNNPLARRRDEPFSGGQPFHAYRWAAERNANLNRDDIEWIVTPDGHLKLVDKESWSRRHTKDMAAHAEQSRRQHAHRMNYPITAHPQPKEKE